MKKPVLSRWVLALLLMILFGLQGGSAPAVSAQSYPFHAYLPHLAQAVQPVPAQAPVYHYQIVHTYPHDRSAYTEGLFYLGGYLYEGTGSGIPSRPWQAEVRKELLTDGRQVLQRTLLPSPYYGEGIAPFGSKIYELTESDSVYFNYDLATFAQTGPFAFTPRMQGWGLTQDGAHLIMSDGTSTIYFRDPNNFDNVTGTISVNDAGTPVTQLNELEYINGQIWANVWMMNRIAVISPADGHVIQWVDLSGLPAFQDPQVMSDPNAVLNGVAWDPNTGGHIYVTGKNWPDLYEIQVIP